ncbi:MAG TPA: glycosyltransferase family 2 protein [Egibacteraceae bacterium]
MRVTACVVSWNSAAQLGGALDSLLAQGPESGLAEVVVVDNASVDDSRDVARARRDVRLIANARNRGFAGAANQGIAAARAAGSDAVLVCNPDVRLEPGYLAAALRALAADDRRAAVQGRLWRMTATGEPVLVDGRRVLDTTGHVAFRTRLFRNRGEGQPDDGAYDRPDEVFGVSGALALYRLAALDDVALDGQVYDEDLFAYWEDVDLDWRLQLRGWQAWYEPGAHAWHERGGAGPRRSALVERLNFTNRFLVVLKNDDLGALARALPGVALTTLLKAGELALTVPSAFLASPAALRLVPATLAKRRRVQATATVPPGAVVDRWFEPFDYAAWVRTWWRRVRAS